MSKNRELKLQELADQLVRREVYYCVSALMYGIGKIMWDCKGFRDAFGDYPDDVMNLFQQDDWETSATTFIEDDADFDDLEKIANEYGDWDEMLKELKIPEEAPEPTHWVCVDCLLPLVNGDFTALGDLPRQRQNAIREGMDHFPGNAHHLGPQYDDEFSAAQCDCCGTTLAGERFAFSDGSDTDDDLEARIKFASGMTGESVKDIEKELRRKVDELVDGVDDGYGWVGREFNLDPDTTEVYEHWIVSSWLARRLEEKGCITGEFASLTIWGRTTTGQMISMDYVIRQIAAELWAEELAEVKEDAA